MRLHSWVTNTDVRVNNEWISLTFHVTTERQRTSEDSSFAHKDHHINLTLRQTRMLIEKLNTVLQEVESGTDNSRV